MIEYRVKGLSCGNCARTLEEEIKRLDYGDTASLSFASGKLKLDERVPLDRVRQILKSDRAYLVEQPAEQGSGSGHASAMALTEAAHTHDHSNDHSQPHAHEHSGFHDHSQPHSHEHSHEHDHAHSHGSKRMIALLAVSTAIYVAALIMDGRLSSSLAVVCYLLASALSG